VIPKKSLILLLLVALLLPACRADPTTGLFELTGEEDFLPQLRGLSQLGVGRLRPQPQTAPYAPVAHAGVNPFGINVFLEQEVEPQKRERALEMIAAAGFHWIRQEFPWEDIEIHGKGDFEDRRHEPYRSAWEKYDHIVETAAAHGVQVVPRLSNPPAWTRAAGDAAGTYAPPDELSDWGDYVHAVVSRYKGRIRYYQLWNEPNIYPEWGEQPVNPEAYTALLCEGYRRAKEADPDVVILSGALAPTVSLDPGPGPARGMNEFVFLQRMYDAGAAGCFDVLTVNDYMLWSGPTDRRLEPLTINFSRPTYLRDIMVTNGDAHKAIWISEMNANAVPNDPAIQGWGGYGQVTLEQQARYATRAYQRAMEEWPWVGVVNFWFFKRATDIERDQAWYYFRMVEPDFTPLPVYEAMQSYTRGLSPTLHPGTHQENHWALTYAGAWERVSPAASPLHDYQRSAQAGDALQFAFTGRSVTLHPGPEEGRVAVRVDDGPARTVTLAGEAVRLARARPGTHHQVRVEVLSGTVSVDQLVVRAAPRLLPWAAGAALAVGLLLAAGFLRRARRAL
jgi:hypothetical protein